MYEDKTRSCAHIKTYTWFAVIMYVWYVKIPDFAVFCASETDLDILQHIIPLHSKMYDYIQSR